MLCNNAIFGLPFRTLSLAPRAALVRLPFSSTAAPLSPATTEGAHASSLPGGDQDRDDDPEALLQRKQRSVQSYLEQQLGGGDPDRTTLAVLLQRHGVVVRGGPAEALRLMEALTAWKRGEWRVPGEAESSA